MHAHGDAHAAADAERGEALLGVALLHLIEQRGENARARGADRMTEGDGAAIDVELGRIEAELLADRDRLCSEGLIGLDEIKILHRPAGLLERGLRGAYRADAHDRRIDARGRPR